MPENEPKPRGGANPKTRPDDARGAKPGTGTVLPAHGGRIGNPPFVPTDKMRDDVRTWAKLNNHETIAGALGISKSTLERHFPKELGEGAFEAGNAVGAKLLQKAMQGNVTCMIFYLRTRAKWNVRVEHTGADGAPIRHVDLTPQLENMTDDQLALLQPLLEQLLTEGGSGFDGGDQGFGGADQGDPGAA